MVKKMNAVFAMNILKIKVRIHYSVKVVEVALVEVVFLAHLDSLKNSSKMTCPVCNTLICIITHE